MPHGNCHPKQGIKFVLTSNPFEFQNLHKSTLNPFHLITHLISVREILIESNNKRWLTSNFEYIIENSKKTEVCNVAEPNRRGLLLLALESSSVEKNNKLEDDADSMFYFKDRCHLYKRCHRIATSTPESSDFEYLELIPTPNFFQVSTYLPNFSFISFDLQSNNKLYFKAQILLI